MHTSPLSTPEFHMSLPSSMHKCATSSAAQRQGDAATPRVGLDEPANVDHLLCLFTGRVEKAKQMARGHERLAHRGQRGGELFLAEARGHFN